MLKSREYELYHLLSSIFPKTIIIPSFLLKYNQYNANIGLLVLLGSIYFAKSELLVSFVLLRSGDTSIFHKVGGTINFSTSLTFRVRIIYYLVAIKVYISIYIDLGR